MDKAVLLGGVEAGHLEHGLHGHAQVLHQVSDAVENRLAGTHEPAGIGEDKALGGDVDGHPIGGVVVTHRSPGQMGAVRDHHETVGTLHPEVDLEHLSTDMEPVADDLALHILVEEAGAQAAHVPVVKPAHHVAGMSGYRDASPESLIRLSIVVVTVGIGQSNTLGEKILHHRLDAGDLRRQSHQAEQTVASLHHGLGGLHAHLGPTGLDALLPHPVEPGPLTVDTQDGGAVLRSLVMDGSNGGNGLRGRHGGENIDGALRGQALQVALDRSLALSLGLTIAGIVAAGTVVMGVKGAGDDPQITIIHRLRVTSGDKGHDLFPLNGEGTRLASVGHVDTGGMDLHCKHSL